MSVNFENDFDSWVANGKPDKKQIVTGFASPALQSIGIEEKYIVWDTSKINRIQREHPSMSDNVLKQIPTLLINPIIVMTSITQVNRVIIYGEVYDDKGIPVLTVLELLPVSRGNYILDMIRIANAYSKDSIEKTQNLINNSEILYICSDEKRTLTWLSRSQLQLPLGITKFGSIGKVTYFERDVNGNYSFSPRKSADSEPEWKTKLKGIDLQESDSEVNETIIAYDAMNIAEAETWLSLNRLQLPLVIAKTAPAGKVTNFEQG